MRFPHMISQYTIVILISALKWPIFLICVFLWHFPHMISVVPSLCLDRFHPMIHAAPQLLQVDDLCTWRTKSPRKLCTFWLPRNVRPKKLGRNHGKSHEKCPSYILFIFIYEGYNMIQRINGYVYNCRPQPQLTLRDGDRERERKRKIYIQLYIYIYM